MNIPESRKGLLNCVPLMKLMIDKIISIIRLASVILSILSYSTFFCNFKITVPSKTIMSNARNIMLMDVGMLKIYKHAI